MRKSISRLFLSMVLLILMGCNEAVTSTETSRFEHYITVVVGDDHYDMGYNDQSETVFDLILDSSIDLEYTSTDYGPMIIGVNNFEADSFHWIGFTKNDELASMGLDSIGYEDGDVFEFYEYLTTWQQSLTMTYQGNNEEYHQFKYGEDDVLIPLEAIELKPLIENETYTINGQVTEAIDGDIVFDVSQIEANYDGYIKLSMNNTSNYLTYMLDDGHSVFDMIEQSSIGLAFEMTDFGPFITGIGSLKANDFYWLAFTKNGEYAMEGLTEIAYENGDSFVFSENLITWQTTIQAELMSIEDNYLLFENDNQAFSVYHSDIDDFINFDNLTVGFIYDLSGIPSSTTTKENYVFIPSSISLSVFNDFTDLYQLEIGDVFLLSFTVTYKEESSEFGFEIFAKDINDLSSTNISNQMSYPSDTDYIFYSFPDTYDLKVGQTYIGKFIYQVNEPSSIPQFTLYAYNLNGEPIQAAIIQ